MNAFTLQFSLMHHYHTFSIPTDQLSWRLSLALGLSLAVGQSWALNCVILMQPLSKNYWFTLQAV